MNMREREIKEKAKLSPAPLQWAVSDIICKGLNINIDRYDSFTQNLLRIQYVEQRRQWQDGVFHSSAVLDR